MAVRAGSRRLHAGARRLIHWQSSLSAVAVRSLWDAQRGGKLGVTAGLSWTRAGTF